MSTFIQDNLDVIDALAFFGISENNIEEALDLKAIERINMKHQFGDSNTKAKSNSYFAIIRNKQHIIEKIVNELGGVSKANVYNEAPTQEPTNSGKSRARETVELQEFRAALSRSLKNMEVDENGKIAKKETVEKPWNPTYQNAPTETTRRPLYEQRNTQQNRNTYSNQYNSSTLVGADGVCKAGAILSIIFASITSLVALSFLAFMPMFGLIWLGLCIWTIVANAQVCSGSAQSNVGAGVLGLLCGGFLGGILTLAGRYNYRGY